MRRATFDRCLSTTLAALTLLVVSLVSSSRADQFGPGSIVVGAVDYPTAAAAADLDGDGDQDVLVPAGIDDELVWYENLDGQGTFGAQRLVGQKDGPSAVSAADLDGDGDLDVLCGGNDELTWYENLDGKGTFGPGHVIATDSIAAPAAVAVDVDADGDLDVAAAWSSSFFPGRAVWYENTDGAGTFGSEQLVASALSLCLALDAGDVDGDADADLLVTSYSDGRIDWYENTDGLGGFALKQVITTAPAGVISIRAADPDADGDLDVASASFDDDAIAWYENSDGAGTTWVQHVVGTNNGVRWVSAADLDGDGDEDLLTASRYTSQFAWYPNLNGLGTFGPPQVLATSLDPFSAVASDLDGDGDRDVLWVATGADTVAWQENTDGLGTFGAERAIAGVARQVTSLAAADVDGDGDQDVLSSSALDGTIAWYENADGLGAFGAQRVVTTGVNAASVVHATDVDGDGDHDVLAGGSPARAAWYENTDGAGTFALGQDLDPFWWEYDRDMTTADVDGDGDVDVLRCTPVALWQENLDGAGSFGPKMLVGDGSGSETVAAADFDGDGDVDLVCPRPVLGSVVWFQNADGQGTFGPTRMVCSASSPTSAIPADLDADGDQDVVFVALFTLAWCENVDGLGTFGAPQALPTGGAFVVARPVAADVDRDGDVDVVGVVDVAPAGSLVWFENLDGAGTFGAAEELVSAADGTFDLVVASDVDADGDLDVVAEGPREDDVSWYRNGQCTSVLPALEAVRLGSPPNPAVLLPGVTSGPAIGKTWDPVIDHTTFLPNAVVDVVGITLAPSPTDVVTPLGTLLCDISNGFVSYATPPGVPFAIAVPDACVLVGFPVYAQGFSGDLTMIALTNAIDVTIGSY